MSAKIKIDSNNIEKIYIHDYKIQQKFGLDFEKKEFEKILDNAENIDIKKSGDSYTKDENGLLKKKYKVILKNVVGKGNYILQIVEKDKGSDKDKNNKKIKYRAMLICSNGNKLNNFINFIPKYVSFSFNKELEVGNVYSINGRLEKFYGERNYKGFNSKFFNYSKFKYFNILNVGNLSKIDWNKNDCLNFFDKINFLINYVVFKSKEKLYCLADKYIVNSNIFKGLVLGDTSKLEEEIKEDFKELNIYHMLAVSGAHVAYFVLVLKVIFKNIKNSKIRSIVLDILLLFFMLISDVTSSVSRACLMVVIQDYFERKNRDINFWYLLLITYFSIILINPYRITDIGLYLSYFGSAGIVLFNSILGKLNIFEKLLVLLKIEKIKDWRLKEKLKEGTLHKSKFFRKIWLGFGYLNILKTVLKYIFDTLFVSISVQILILPIIWNSFNNLNLNFIISNIVMTPFLGLSIITGIIFMLCSLFYIFIYKIFFLNIIYDLFNSLLYLIGLVVNIFVTIVLFLISSIKKFMFLSFKTYDINIFFLIGYYLFVFLLIYLLNLKIKFNKLKKNHVYICYLLLIFIIFLFFVGIGNDYFRELRVKNSIEINFVDVGQGDASYICVNGKNILVDTGEGRSFNYPQGEKVFYPYLIKKNVKTIDYLILSHFDSDHSGGAYNIIESLDVKNIVIAPQININNQYRDIVKLCKKKNVNIIRLVNGKKIKIVDNVEIETIFPAKSINDFILENATNNNSLVFKLNIKKLNRKNIKINWRIENGYYDEIDKNKLIDKMVEDGELSILYTGDIEKIAEDKMINSNYRFGKIDILKSPHHGSNTSSSEKFLNKVKPKLAVISCGINNKFNHPSKEILKRYIDMGIYILRTDLKGEISIEISGK